MPSMHLKQKIEEVKEFCWRVVGAAKNPALMCSFGKDSMVLLHIIREFELPILCFRDPYFPKKWAFSNRVIVDWNLQVWDYPPLFISMLYGPKKTVLVHDYEAAGGTISIPHGLVDGTELCGVDVFNRPRARFNFLWDMCLVGHRNVDVDAVYGPVPLHNRVLKREVGPSFCFPLKDWTDEEIWDYTEEFEVPVDFKRYDLENRCEWEDKTLNSDYWNICIKCIDKRRAGEKVFCYKTGGEIENVSQHFPLFPKTPDYFDHDKV